MRSELQVQGFFSKNVGGRENGRLFCLTSQTRNLSPFATNTSGKLDVLGHDGDSLGVDSAQVGVFKKTDEVSFAGFLQGHYCRTLETKISLEVLCNFTDQTLEWEFPDEKLCAFLVSPDFTESDCSRPVSVWFLDTSSRRCTFTCGFGGQLLSWSLSSGRFSCSLLCTCHLDLCAVRRRMMTKA